MQADRERNCTHNEFLHCYAKEDPTFALDRKSTRGFKTLNSASAQSTHENRLNFQHRTAYPRVVCDPPRLSEDLTEDDDVRNLLGMDAKKRPFAPSPRNTLRHYGTTENKASHDPKVPIQVVPVRTEEFIQYTGLSMGQKGELDDLKKVPYDAQCKEALGMLNSVYRTDYGQEADSEKCGAFKVARPANGVVAPRSSDVPLHKHEVRVDSCLRVELQRAKTKTGELQKRFEYLSATTPRMPPTEYGRKVAFVPFGKSTTKGRPSTATTTALSTTDATASSQAAEIIPPVVVAAADAAPILRASTLSDDPPTPRATHLVNSSDVQTARQAVAGTPPLPYSQVQTARQQPDVFSREVGHHKEVATEEYVPDAVSQYVERRPSTASSFPKPPSHTAADEGAASNMKPQPPMNCGKRVRPHTAKVFKTRGAASHHHHHDAAIPKLQPCPATFIGSDETKQLGKRIVTSPRKALAAASVPGTHQMKKGTTVNTFCAQSRNKRFVALPRTFFAKQATYVPYSHRAQEGTHAPTERNRR